MEKKIHVPILWDKTYRAAVYFGEGNGGVLMIYRFLILRYSNGNRFEIRPNSISFSDPISLSEQVTGMSEWDTKDKNYRDASLPEEAVLNLKKHGLEKYI
jgi:hypothetical protein